MRKLLLCVLLLCGSAFAQFGSGTTRRIISGTAAPPATCNAGPVDVYVRTGATSPGLYLCLSTNTFTGPLGGGAATSCGSPTCTVSSAGNGNGVLALSGNTSGTATLTAPAVAGTNTNPIVFSNIISVPNGGSNNAAIQSSVFGAGTGFYFAGNNAPAMTTNSGVLVYDATSSPIVLRSTGGGSLGSAAQPWGQVNASGQVSTGTTFTASGCGNTTLVGGASAGKYTSVTAGACTVTITMGNSLTSATGWTCDAHDLTTVADANNITMGTSTATTANLVEGTVAANDVISFKCTGY